MTFAGKGTFTAIPSHFLKKGLRQVSLNSEVG